MQRAIPPHALASVLVIVEQSFLAAPESQLMRNAVHCEKLIGDGETRSGDVVEETLSTGAGGYVVQSNGTGELLVAIKAVLEGQRFISASLTGQLLVATMLSTGQLL